jgi:hypothetical protein
MEMLLDSATGRQLVTTAQAAKEFGCSTHYIRMLAREGILWSRVESPRVVLYDHDEIRRLAREKKATRKKRGGRPPNGFRAA